MRGPRRAVTSRPGRPASVPGGATVSGTVTLSATGAPDGETALETATFYLDGVVIARDRAAQFNVPWNSKTVADGSHSLTTKMALNDGRVFTTGARTIIVDNTP